MCLTTFGWLKFWKQILSFALQEKGWKENHQLTTDIFGFRGIDAVHTNFAKINFRTRRRKDQCAKKGASCSNQREDYFGTLKILSCSCKVLREMNSLRSRTWKGMNFYRVLLVFEVISISLACLPGCPINSCWPIGDPSCSKKTWLTVVSLHLYSRFIYPETHTNQRFFLKKTWMTWMIFRGMTWMIWRRFTPPGAFIMTSTFKSLRGGRYVFSPGQSWSTWFCFLVFIIAISLLFYRFLNGIISGFQLLFRIITNCLWTPKPWNTKVLSPKNMG